MSVIDNYGEFEMPEEKEHIEVDENPVHVVNSLYELFKTKVKGIYNKRNAYELAEELLLDKKDLKIKGSEIEEILNFLRKDADSESLAGLFLSALNNTIINTLIINDFPKLDCIGYRLAKNKKLLLGRKVITIWAGYDGQGVLINNGSVISFADETTDGTQINNGRTAEFAFYTSGGIQINNGLVRSSFSSLINKGLQINNGTLEFELSQYITEKIIDLKRKFKNKKINLLKSQLQNKISELDFLKNIKNETYEQIANKIDAYDFNKFEKDATGICKKIKKLT